MNTNFNININNLYAYLRVSTKKQYNDYSHGIPIQRMICEGYKNNIYPNKNIVFFEEINSSYNNENALLQLNKLSKKLQKDDVILIKCVSRLGRNVFQVTKFLKQIEKVGAYIVAIMDGLCYNKDKLQNNLFLHKVIDARNDSDNKSIKTQTVYKYIKLNGGHYGKIPFGKKTIRYNNIPKLYDNIDEYRVIKQIMELYRKEQNITNIIKVLHDNNIYCRGKLWSYYMINKIITSQKHNCKNILSKKWRYNKLYMKLRNGKII